MTYQHLVDKIIRYQDKLHDRMNEYVTKAKLPADLVEKANAADLWGVQGDIKLGKAEVPELTPNIDPLMDYSNALWTYKDMFDEKTQSEIGEYKELVEELFTSVKDPIQ